MTLNAVARMPSPYATRHLDDVTAMTGEQLIVGGVPSNGCMPGFDPSITTFVRRAGWHEFERIGFPNPSSGAMSSGNTTDLRQIDRTEFTIWRTLGYACVDLARELNRTSFL